MAEYSSGEESIYGQLATEYHSTPGSPQEHLPSDFLEDTKEGLKLSEAGLKFVERRKMLMEQSKHVPEKSSDSVEDLEEQVEDREETEKQDIDIQHLETSALSSSPEIASNNVALGDQGLVRMADGSFFIDGIAYTLYLEDVFKSEDKMYLSVDPPMEYETVRRLWRVKSFLRCGETQRLEKSDRLNLGGVGYFYRTTGPFRGTYTRQKQVAYDYVVEDVACKEIPRGFDITQRR